MVLPSKPLLVFLTRMSTLWFCKPWPKPRAAGESKYPLSKMIRFAADAVTAFSVVPLMASMTIGWVMAVVGFAFFVYSIIGWLLGLNVPVVLMVGLRGWTRHGVTQDTAAVYTERFLNAFNINYYLVESDADASRITVAFEEAQKTKRPVAILVGDEYHGFMSK